VSDCKHNKSHKAAVSVGYMEDSGRFTCELRVQCGDCGRAFQFIGLPLGLDLQEGATMSVDGQEARLAIAPVGTVPQPLDKALLRGYRVKMPGDH
jgi:hypothetical protein